MSVKVYLSTHVRAYTGGRGEVEAEGSDLAGLLADLDRRFPGIRFRVVDEQDRIRRHMNFFVGESLVRDLRHSLREGDEVHILGALSGG